MAHVPISGTYSRNRAFTFRRGDGVLRLPSAMEAGSVLRYVRRADLGMDGVCGIPNCTLGSIKDYWLATIWNYSRSPDRAYVTRGFSRGRANGAHRGCNVAHLAIWGDHNGRALD